MRRYQYKCSIFLIYFNLLVVFIDKYLCRGMGMEVCCTLGMLEKQQAEELKKAGLTAYNHNLDTSREYYPNIISTRSYDDRLQTLQHVREAGISVCSGDCA
jgi:biotin synthase